MGASKEEAAAHVFLSAPALDALIARGVVKRPDGVRAWNLDEVRRACVMHWRDVAAGRKSDGEGGEVLYLAAERARLAREQANGHEMKNAEMRGELMQRDEVKSIWSRRALSWKERIRSVPVVALSRVPGMTKKQARAVGELIDEALVELADGGSGGGIGKRRRAADARGRRAPKAAAEADG